MIYRRFGRTGLRMPVFTCGGMRYQQSWKDLPPAEIEAGNQANLEACIRRAVEAGIHHIETARGYGSSELQLGRILPSLPRDQLIVQTKIGPHDSGAAFLATFETSLGNLKLDYVDLLGIHGINTDELLRKTIEDGTLESALALQRQGRVRHIGFSTHGPTSTILKAIASGAFSYVNLHWYYFDQANWPAVEAATARDMGVFIISPNDKGGMLHAPPSKLAGLCRPLSPMAFNDLFCLSHPQVHTLSLGLARPSDLDAHLQALPWLDRAAEVITPVRQRIEAEAARQLGADWVSAWNQGIPATDDTPGLIPIYQILRLYGLARAFDMTEYAKARYNLLGNGGHWFPGAKADENTDWRALGHALAGHPLRERILAALEEAHGLFNNGEQKRLSESG